MSTFVYQATNTGNGNASLGSPSGSPSGGNTAGGEGSNTPPGSAAGNMRNVPPGGGPANMGFSLYHDPYNHASFRAQYVNRIRPDEPPRSMNFSR